jgi:hypothetical protein
LERQLNSVTPHARNVEVLERSNTCSLDGEVIMPRDIPNILITFIGHLLSQRKSVSIVLSSFGHVPEVHEVEESGGLSKMLNSILDLILSLLESDIHFSIVSFSTVYLDAVALISVVFVNVDMDAAVLSRLIEKPILIDIKSLVSLKRNVVVCSFLGNISVFLTVLVHGKLNV